MCETALKHQKVPQRIQCIATCSGNNGEKDNSGHLPSESYEVLKFVRARLFSIKDNIADIETSERHHIFFI